MTREEFVSLTLRQALGALWDALDLGRTLQEYEAPRMPARPRFDQRIGTGKGIFVWASECDLDRLRQAHGRARASAEKPGEWQAQNAKEAKSLGFWREWREANPSAQWHGERDRVPDTVAEPPSAIPRQYDRQARAEPRQEAPARARGADDDLPF